jgi:Domain of unknown function (DUF4832)/Domain of unknown function (DUF4874)
VIGSSRRVEESRMQTRNDVDAGRRGSALDCIFAAAVVLSLAACGGGSSPPTVTATAAAADASAQTVSYEASADNFPNPERGALILHQPSGSNGVVQNREPLTEPGVMDYFKRERERTGATTVRVVYSLAEWRAQPIAQAFLDRLGADFDAARANGFKLIPYFSYAWVQDQGNAAAVDASADWTVRHVEQIGPMLQRHSDVLALMIAGFVGAWGEWHDSSAGNVGPNGEVNDNSRRIANALFAAAPANRSVVLRYATLKRELLGTAPLTADEAFSGTNRARAGFHDEGILQNKWGTDVDFDWYDAYIRAEGAYAPSVEMFDTNTQRDGTQLSCQRLFDELARRQSDLMNDTTDMARIEPGCEGTVRTRIGYRYRLQQATLPTSATAGAQIALSLRIANDGWSPAFNPRPVNLVLRGRSTQQLRAIALPTDPRRWAAGQVSSVDATVQLPGDLPADTYDLLLHLPDAAEAIANRPEYAIRLAHREGWDANTGYNALGASLRVE